MVNIFTSQVTKIILTLIGFFFYESLIPLSFESVSKDSALYLYI